MIFLENIKHPGEVGDSLHLWAFLTTKELFSYECNSILSPLQSLSHPEQIL